MSNACQLNPVDGFDERVEQADLFGDDNRLEIYELKNEHLIKSARATGLLAYGNGEVGELLPLGYNGPLGEELEAYFEIPVCDEVRFVEQRAIASGFCSGFLIAPDLFLTVGHCLINYPEGSDCSELQVWFDYGIEQENVPARPPSGGVVCSEVLINTFDMRESPLTRIKRVVDDFALLRLSNPVLDREPLSIGSQDVSQGSEIATVGFPLSLPAKVSVGALAEREYREVFLERLMSLDPEAQEAVLDEEASPTGNSIFFEAPNFSGNSGGPLIDTSSGKVIGTVTNVGLRYKGNMSEYFPGSSPGIDFEHYQHDEDRERPCVSAFNCEREDNHCLTNSRATRLSNFTEALSEYLND